MEVDLQKELGRNSGLALPAEGAWQIMKIRIINTSTVELDTESYSMGPDGRTALKLTLHFLSPDKFWLEAEPILDACFNAKGERISCVRIGPDKPWYRLSGPGENPQPPSPEAVREHQP
jgi:hypothetical protein